MAQWQPGRKVEFVEESLSAIQEADRFKGRGAREPRRGKDTFTCPGCGMHTYGGKDYCTNCGFHLNTTCPRCGMKSRYECQYAFCPDCGGALGWGEAFEGEQVKRGAAGFALTNKEAPKQGESS